MLLVESLLTAIVRADGDALVMHVGEKPYVIASSGPIELSSHGLNLDAMARMIEQMLPAELQRTLSEFGAVEHELAGTLEMQADRFTVVAARGGDDVWIEIRRHRRARPHAAVPPTPASGDRSMTDAGPEETPPMEAPPVDAPDPTEPPQADHTVSAAQPGVLPVESPPAGAHDGGAPIAGTPYAVGHAEADVPQPDTPTVEAPVEAPESQPGTAEPPVPAIAASAETAHAVTSEVVAQAVADSPEAHAGGISPGPAAVLPMTRTLRIEVPPAGSPRMHDGPSEIERLLGLAAARGATALYLTTQARPFVRVDDDVRMLEDEVPLSSTDIESAVLALMPEAPRDVLRRGEPIEWVAELAGIGRVRCATFRDYRGPGAIFQLISMRPVSAEQLGFSPAIQTLATEGDGLVIVASPRGHGKTTLVGAFVDLINRQRPGYVITLERQIRLVHEHQTALISQREMRGPAEQSLSVARAALRENPDVLVLEDPGSADLFQLAIDAAGSGLLVFVSVTAASATAALARIAELYPVDRRKAVYPLLAERLRGVVAQLLLRKAGGGRVAAREVVLATAAVARAIADGQLHDLPLAIDSGRKHGLVSLTDALVEYVRSGAVDVREAYRKADDRDALLAALKRENVDTAVLERLA